MKPTTPVTFKIKMPSDADLIPPIRKFIAEILQVYRFGPKFSFRSEVIVDELCYNAIMYGSQSIDAAIDLVCSIFSDRCEFQINDEGGDKENVERLKIAIEKGDEPFEEEDEHFVRSSKGLGLEIVRMLSAKVKLRIKKDNITSINIVKNREDS